MRGFKQESEVIALCLRTIPPGNVRRALRNQGDLLESSSNDKDEKYKVCDVWEVKLERETADI